MPASIVLLALIQPQVEAAPYGAREELEGLIEQTNGLAHFHVEYAVRIEDEVSQLTIDYLAPYSMHIRQEWTSLDAYYVCNQDTFWHRAVPDSSEASEARFDLRDRSGPCEAAIALLDDCSWKAIDGPRVFFDMPWDLDSERRPTDSRFSIGMARYGEPNGSLLGWLAALQQADGQLSIEGAELVHRGPRSTTHVDTATGFLRRLHLTVPGKKPVTFELLTLDLAAAPHEELFATPEPFPGASDVTLRWRGWYVSRLRLRRLALERVHGLLERGERRLDDGLRDELERFLAALHDPEITRMWGGWLADARTWTAETADWFRWERRKGVPVDKLQIHVDKDHAKIVRDLDTSRGRVREDLPDDPAAFADSPHWRALRELEDAVLDARFDALIAEPMIEEFDRQLDAALDG